ncbi:type II secretion system F family protein [Algimonas porphyrae]|uniref:Secretion protein F n=1 Tax=Algimonas porphyrae TaxID=1128113 RepID=A0ABQ5V004_9PROT|nr:type II secretion system F family protein [Algimonas porphyrae]GLQ19956.1 secretion protein F [Algimonas porphyrae]
MEQTLILALAGAGIVGIIGYMLISGSGGSAKSARVGTYTGKKSIAASLRGGQTKVDESGNRRKQIEESLKKLEDTQKSKKKAAKSINAKLLQADVSMSRSTFLTISLAIALVVAVLGLILGFPILLLAAASFVAGFGLPRMVLNMKIKRRQKKFVAHFADGMDIIVRGVRTGLPLGDCLKIIAHESPDPMGAEFRRVVEAEAVGVPIEICLEQMFERLPIAEVNFFATVLNIQKTTGGNLGESLANLSNVLRSRKILAEKIKALSAEAKMSAIIIGALPIVVMGLVSIMSPDYMTQLFTTDRGQQNLMIGAVMMGMGIFIMRKMIDFKY